MNQNPLISYDPSEHPLGSIPFDAIKTEHFLPAIEKGIEQTWTRIEAIAATSEPATFANTIEALEYASKELDFAASIYWNLHSIESDGDFKALAEEISPKLAALQTKVMTYEPLFARVKTLWDSKDQLNLEAIELRLLEKNYKGFIRNGALLSPADKEKLGAIDEELSKLNPQFSKNVLDATNDYVLHLTDEADLAGLPQGVRDQAAATAKAKNLEGWAFTLQMPSYMPFLMYADKRELREKLSDAMGSVASSGQWDNRPLITRILKLRKERAQLLGYADHPSYVLEERMAQKPETVTSFIDNMYELAFPAAKREVEEVAAFAKKLDGIEQLESFDYAYYEEKLKKEKFNLDEEMLRPYFKMESVVQGAFDVATKLYGISFTPINDVQTWHKDVTVYKVSDGDGSHVGVLYVDLFPRDTKRSGAWMNDLIGQGWVDGKDRRPHILISGNMTPSTPDSPSLLRYDEVRTVFHEFGHALHGLLSQVRYPSLGGPNVRWDFVELPSQIMENWMRSPESLALFAVHHETGEVIPQEMVEKIVAAENFMAGYMTNRQLQFGHLDMSYHLADPDSVTDVVEFEKAATERHRLYPQRPGCFSARFQHIFAGGYSSGYYSYKWAEVLEADAFELFEEKGIFDPETATSFRTNILSAGNSREPMDLYVSFRGREPDPNALMKKHGLV